MGKVFTEKEAADILQRAVALQESTADASANPPYTPGITEEELRRIALESGLDARFLDMALAEGPPPPAPRRTFLDWAREHERVIDAELPIEKFDLILDAIGPSNGRSMGLRQVGTSIEGQFAKGFGFGRLRLTSKQGRTRLWVRSMSFLPFMCFMYPGLLAGVIGGVMLLAFGLIVPGLAALIGAPLLGFLGMRLTQKRCHADIAKIVDQLTDVITQEAVRPAQSLASADDTMVETVVQ